MIAAIGEKEYFTSRATSTVPAALIAHIPLVTRCITPTTLCFINTIAFFLPTVLYNLDYVIITP